jgi:SpoVK/Ycf46/Vps4 family AAA+-type ATPase
MTSSDSISVLRLAGFANDGSQVYVDTDGCFYAHGSPSLCFFYKSLATKIALFKVVETDEYNNSKELHLQVPASSSGRFNGWKRVGGINPRKAFDGLFFDQKKTLVDLLQRFKKHSLYPANVPMANKLGILLYGPPGTGKTGTISAIANMLGRHVCMVDFSKIQSREDLDAILNPAIYKSNMYVFDEFDCILDVITDRPASVQTENTDWGTLLLSATGDERKAILEAMKAQQSKPVPIDLGYLLQKLDGLESAEDRIIVATTNHPEKLHPALVRPGRFDLKLCLGNCSTSMYVDIISIFYENDETIRAKVAAANIPERKHSPLTVINAALQERDIDHLLDALLA